jgi:hypothetical protein
VFGVIFALAIAMLGFGEYGIGLVLLFVSGFSLWSKLWHREQNSALRWIGALLIMIGIAIGTMIAVDAKDDQPWSRLPHAWARFIGKPKKIFIEMPVIYWGVSPGMDATITLDTSRAYASDNRDYVVMMLVCRAKDDTVDQQLDTQIDKSNIFHVQPYTTTLQLKLSEGTIRKLILRGMVQFMVLVAPKTFDLTTIKNVQEALDGGAQIVANPGFDIGVRQVR